MTSPEGGKDVQLFRALCCNVFERIAEGVSEDRFYELFRGPLVTSKSKARKLVDRFRSGLINDLTENLNDMIEEEKLDEKFTKRGELLQKQYEFEGTSAWRPTGDPTKDLRSHDMKALIEIKAAMDEYLNEKEPYIDGLLEKVRLDRKRAADLQKNTQKISDNIAAENTRLDELEEGYLKILNTLARGSE